MLEHYLAWYRYALESFEYPLYNVVDLSDIKKVIVTGMGGSGIVGDMLALMALDFGDVDIYVFKDFYIPKKFMNPKTFVLAISYSGNTLETLSSVAISLSHDAKVGVVTSGGKLLEIARSKNLPHVIVKSGFAPRVALPMMFVASVKLLSSCNINVMPMDLLRTSVKILDNVDEAKDIANKIANMILNSYAPTVVASTRYQALAFRIKNELNENSKIPVKVEILPELFHNDIVGWEEAKLRDLAILINSDIEYENKLLSFYKEFLNSLGVKTLVLELKGNIVERYLFGSLVAGVASVYVAQYRGLDPLTTRSITMYKNAVKNLEKEIFKYHKIDEVITK